VPARCVHEELQWIERARDRCGCDRARLLGRLLAHDDVALFERGAQTGDVVVGQFVLVGESLNVLFLDETALGGLLEQALDRREVMQMNRVAQCVVPFGLEGLPDFGAPGGVIRLTTAASPPVRVIERRCTEVHSQTRCFSISVQSLIPCLRRENSSLDGPARDRVETDAEDDDVRPELPRFGSSACGARETLSQQGKRRLDCLAPELFAGAVRDHAPPASLTVRVVLVYLDADPRIFAQHRGFAALGRDRDDGAVLVRVDERDDVRDPVAMAAETCDPLAAQELLDLIA
jgi:hypothetical protein